MHHAKTGLPRRADPRSYGLKIQSVRAITKQSFCTFTTVTTAPLCISPEYSLIHGVFLLIFHYCRIYLLDSVLFFTVNTLTAAGTVMKTATFLLNIRNKKCFDVHYIPSAHEKVRISG